MGAQIIRVVSAVACEDLRTDSDDKIIAIGILTPKLDIALSGEGDPEKAPALRLHFLLVVDFIGTGEIVLRFRLRKVGARFGSRKKMNIVVVEKGNRIPLPVGPFTFHPKSGDRGFELQYEVQEGKWRRIGQWMFEKPVS